MALSARQAYVLANLERVVPLPYKVTVKHPLARYQLDGRECTAQIIGLVVRKQIRECKDGALERLSQASEANGTEKHDGVSAFRLAAE